MLGERQWSSILDRLRLPRGNIPLIPFAPWMGLKKGPYTWPKINPGKPGNRNSTYRGYITLFRNLDLVKVIFLLLTKGIMGSTIRTLENMGKSGP